MVIWHPLPNQLADVIVSADDISFTLEEVATATTLTADHFFLVVDTSGGNVTLTLPAIADHNQRMYTIKNIGSNKVTIVGPIDGEDAIDLNLENQYVWLIGDSNRETWHIIGGLNVKLEDILERYLGQQVDKQQETIDLLKNIETHLAEGSGEELNKEESE